MDNRSRPPGVSEKDFVYRVKRDMKLFLFALLAGLQACRVASQEINGTKKGDMYEHRRKMMAEEHGKRSEMLDKQHGRRRKEMMREDRMKV